MTTHLHTHSTTSTPALSHKDRLVLLWTLRIAAQVPVIFSSENHRRAAEPLMELVGPWVPWPDDLMNDFAIHLLNAIDEDEGATLQASLQGRASDEAGCNHALRQSLHEMDCSELAIPFMNYYRQYRNRIRRAFEDAELQILACEIPRPQPQQGLDQPDAGYPQCIAHRMDRQ